MDRFQEYSPNLYRYDCKTCRGLKYKPAPEVQNLATKKSYYKAMQNPDRRAYYNERMRKYRQERKKAGNPILRNSTEKEEGRLYKWHRDKLRKLVFDLKGKKCHYCGSEKNMTTDHVIPIKQGGTHEMSNLVPACKSCNSSKRDRTPEQWKKDLEQYAQIPVKS